MKQSHLSKITMALVLAVFLCAGLAQIASGHDLRPRPQAHSVVHIMVTAALPTRTFTSPAGGESWLAGTSQTVSFGLSSALSGGQLRIYVSDAASKWFTLTTVAATAGKTSYSVPVTLPAGMTAGSGCRMYVWWQAGSTASWQQLAKSNTFTATALPILTSTNPAGGESWLAGTSQTVSFGLSSALSGGQLRIYVSDAASKWFTLATVAATGQTSYDVPVTLPVTMATGATCRMYVWWQSSSTASWQQLAKSNTFTVTADPPSLGFTCPAGGECWLAGSSQTVRFSLTSALPGGQLSLCAVDGAGAQLALTTVTATPGQTSYSLPVTLPATMTPGSACSIYVSWQPDPTASLQQLAQSNNFTVSASTNSPSGLAMPQAAPAGWHQVFADDFSGTTLDRKKWFAYDNGQPGSDTAGWFAASHLSISNNMLVISAYQDPAYGNKWTTDGIQSKPGCVQTYGKYLVRFRFDSGAGIAHAIILWPADNHAPPEIDFSEDNGADRQTDYATLHYGSSHIHNQVPVDMTQWHTVGVEWTPSRLVYTLDGGAWATVTDANVPAVPMALCIQTQAWATGINNWEQGVNSTTPSRVNFYVDWVVAYALDQTVGQAHSLLQ